MLSTDCSLTLQCICRFDDHQKMQYSKLIPDTNAQENLGRQIKHIWDNPPYSLNKVCLMMFAFHSRFCDMRAAVSRGLSIDYTRSSPRKFSNKRVKGKSDHRGPDTSMKLLSPRQLDYESTPARRSPRVKAQQKGDQVVLAKFNGIPWSVKGMVQNTCPIDNLLMCVFLPYLGHSLIS